MEEEISLRDIIQTLWRGKWIILIFTLVTLTIAVIYSYIVANPTYESKGSVLINNVVNEELPEGSLAEFVNNATSKEVLTEILKSPEVLEKTINDLSLDRSVGSLQSSIEISSEEDNESIINISIKGTNQEILAETINTLVENSRVAIQDKLLSSLALYEERYMNEMKEMDESLQEYLAEYERLEAESGLPLLVLFQQNASGSQYMLEANQELLQELRSLEKITQVEYEQINSKINNTNTKYNELHNKLEEVNSLQQVNVVYERIHTLSSAYTGDEPIAPNKILNIVIGFILGGMIGVFVVFLRSYLHNSN